jgi:hypothetical protein
MRLSFDDDNRLLLLLLHDGEGDVEGSQRLAEEALRKRGRRRRRLLRVEEEERLLELDELVHLRHLPHRGLTVRHASHLSILPPLQSFLLDIYGGLMRVCVVGLWQLILGSSRRAFIYAAAVQPPLLLPPCVVWPCGWWTRPDYQSAWNSIAIRGYIGR